MPSITFYLFISLISLQFFAPGPVCAESLGKFIESGNKAYESGDYGTSLSSYEKAAEVDPDSAAVLFNKGNALYKLGEYTEAFNAYEMAATRAMADNNPELEALSRYNMGNSSYRKAEDLSQKNPPVALEEFNRSSENFKTAVKLSPGLKDAVHNLEVSRMAAKKIEELIRRQQQQVQQQEEAREQIKKELEELSRQQNEAADMSENVARENQQSQGSGSSAGNPMNQLADNQKKITERTKSLSDKLEQQAGLQTQQPDDDQARQHINKALDRQETAQEKLEQSKTALASKHQREAAEELQKALQQLDRDQEEEQHKEKTGQPEAASGKREMDLQPHGDSQEEESQQADIQEMQPLKGESPEDIIDEELESRRYRQRPGITGYKPVERDW